MKKNTNVFLKAFYKPDLQSINFLLLDHDFLRQNLQDNDEYFKTIENEL